MILNCQAERVISGTAQPSIAANAGDMASMTPHETRTDHAERMRRGHPGGSTKKALAKPEIAIEEIDRVIASGVRFDCVLAGAGYRSSGLFRQALSERGLLWATWLTRRQDVYPVDVGLIFPVAGRRRRYHMPNRTPVSAEAMLSDQNGRRSTGDAAPKAG